MPSRVIETHKIAVEVIDLIKAAKKHVTLVSPYLDVSHHLGLAIAESTFQNVDVTVIYREDKRADYRDLTLKLQNIDVDVGLVKFLHAKLYISEHACIMTSMNLVEFSGSNSEEFALYSDERGMLAEVAKYGEGLKRRTEFLPAPPKPVVAKPATPPPSVAPAAAKASPAPSAAKPYGACIRCAGELKFDMAKPLCGTCYKDWVKHKNPEHAEKYCHRCGINHKTTLGKPICYPCYKQTGPATR
jgi:hypothetical protein